MLLDSEGRVLSANASATELCGIEPTALIRSFFLDLVDGADRDELRAGWRRAMAGEIVEPAPVRLVGDDGSVLVEATFHRARNPDTTSRPSRSGAGTRRAAGGATDGAASARPVRARAALAGAPAGAPSVPAGVPLGPDRHGTRRASTTAGSSTPTSRWPRCSACEIDQLVGHTLREFTHPDDVRAAVPHRARLELGIVDSYRLDQRYLRSDGEFVWARTRVSLDRGRRRDAGDHPHRGRHRAAAHRRAAALRGDATTS